MARVATIFIFSLIQLIGAALALGAPGPATMDDPFEITADEIIYDGARNLYVANGNVRIVQGDRNMRAAWVAFSTETRLGVAEGDVELVEAGDRLSAAFMVFNVDTLHGSLFQGRLDIGSEGFKVRARELIRTGENTFLASEGYFTTCRCAEGERVPWALRADKADIELGDYGTLTNTTFEVLGVPVLWIPWMFFPMKSERETGLLLPFFSFGGRGGLSVGLPFFWAAHPQLNVTLTPNYFSERGYKQDVELEYVFGERSGGELFVAGLKDQQNKKPKRRDRWAVLWRHDQELPASWRWQTDLNLSSDNLYSDDFAEMHQYRSFRFIESTSNVARSFGNSGGFGAMLGSRYADDVQSQTSTDRDDYLLQRFAELRGDVVAGTLHGPLGLDARLDSELIYFSGLESPNRNKLSDANPPVPAPPSLRSNGRFFDYGFNGRFNNIPTNGESNGIFEEGEPLDERGTRIVLHPRLTRPFHLGRMLEVVPEIGWQQSLYQTNSQHFADRGLLTARADFRSRLIRDYQSRNGRVMRHILEPRLSWALVSQQRQNHNPLFVPRSDVVQTRLRTLSLENVTRDPSDRTKSTNQVVLALNQRFFSAKGPRAMPRLQADLVTAVDWDFSNADGRVNLVADGRVFSLGPLSGRFRAAFDPKAFAFDEGGVEVSAEIAQRTRFVRRALLSVGYSYLANPPRFFETDLSSSSSFNAQGEAELNQLDLGIQFELAWRLRFTGSAVYSLVRNEKGILQSRGMVEYVSKCRCWGVGVEIRHQKRDGFRGGFMIRFLGLGDERSNLFDGGLGTGINL